MASVDTVAPALTTPRFRATVAAMTGGALLLQLVASARVRNPSVIFDEAGYLGNARWIAQSGATWEMPTAPTYAVGYPLVIAPVTRAFTSVGAQWQAILVVNALLLASLVPLLVLLARRVLGADPATALAAGAVGALVPAVVAAGISAIAENLALPLVPASVLALHATTRGRGPRAYLFGPAVALLYATHARFTAALLIGLVALAIGARRHLIPKAVALGNGALLVGGAGLAWALTRAVVAARWENIERLEGGTTELGELLTSFDGVRELVDTAIGQAWYLAAGSLGLSVIGVAALISQLRRREPATGAGGGPTPSGRGATGHLAPEGGEDPGAPARRLVIGYLLAVALSVFGASVAFFAQNSFRADHLVYGRHNDSFTPVWVAAAVLAIHAADRRRLARLGALAAGTVSALFVALVLERKASSFGGRYSPFAVPAIIRFVDGNPSGTFWRATAAALLGLVLVLALVAVIRRPAVLVPVCVVSFVWAGFGTTGATAAFQRLIYDDWGVPAEVRALGVDGVSIDSRSTGAGFAALSYPFNLPDVRFTTFDPAEGEGPDEAFVLADVDDPARRADGDRIALLDQGGYFALAQAEEGIALWVRPGPEQARLDRAGLLLPEGFPTGLPARARQAEVEITDGQAGSEVELAPGASVAVEVRVRHEGTGSPWPGLRDFSGPARVRVVADIEALTPGGPDGARSGGEIPGWITPGEAFSLTASVFAADQTLEPLPPGRYRVTLQVSQDEPHWRAAPDPDASFTLVVSEA